MTGLRTALARRSMEIRAGLALILGGFLVAAVWPAGGTAAIFVGITLWLVRLTVVVWAAAGRRFSRLSAGVLAAGPAAVALLFALSSLVGAGQALGVIPESKPAVQSAFSPSRPAFASPIPTPTAMPTPSPSPTSAFFPTPTVSATATPAAVSPAASTRTAARTIEPTPATAPISLAFKGPGGEPQPVESKPFTLPAGTYEAAWTATTSGDCGVTINLFASPDNGFSRDIAGVLLDRTTSGVSDLGDVPAGRYLVWAYNACPWTVTIRQRGGDVVAGAELRDRWLTWDRRIADAEGILK